METIAMKTLCCILALGSACFGAHGNTDELAAELKALREEFNQLKQTRQGPWIDQARAHEVRSLTLAMLEDADTRASMASNGLTAGWNGHPYIQSGDGRFRLEVEGQVQLRFVFNRLDTAAGSATDSTRWGFENRRIKIKFGGNIGDFEYKITGAYNRSGGAFELEDAYIMREYGNGFGWRVGQFKAPFMREEIISSTRQLLVDRSLVNEEFNQGFNQGFEVFYNGETFRARVMLQNGFGVTNMTALMEDTEVALTARGEWLIGGSWSQFKDFTNSPGADELGVMLGAAAHYQVDEYGTPGGPEVQDFRLTIDGSIESDVWNAFAAFNYQRLESDPPGGDSDRFGFVLQGGWYFTQSWEGFVRYEFGDYDAADVEDLSVITVGANNYINTKVKWTSDIGFGLNEVDSMWAALGVGWRADDAGKNMQVVIRSQLQLLF